MGESDLVTPSRIGRIAGTSDAGELGGTQIADDARAPDDLRECSDAARNLRVVDGSGLPLAPDQPEVVFRKSSCGRRAELLIERLGMFKPRLKVGWRRFHNKCRVESIAIHRGNCFGSQIVDEAQVVLALWADVNMPASTILQL